MDSLTIRILVLGYIIVGITFPLFRWRVSGDGGFWRHFNFLLFPLKNFRDESTEISRQARPYPVLAELAEAFCWPFLLFPQLALACLLAPFKVLKLARERNFRR